MPLININITIFFKGKNIGAGLATVGFADAGSISSMVFACACVLCLRFVSNTPQIAILRIFYNMYYLLSPYLFNIITFNIFYLVRSEFIKRIFKHAIIGPFKNYMSRFLDNNIYLRSHKVRALANNNKNMLLFYNLFLFFNYYLIFTFFKLNIAYVGLMTPTNHIILIKSIKNIFYTFTIKITTTKP